MGTSLAGGNTESTTASIKATACLLTFVKQNAYITLTMPDKELYVHFLQCGLDAKKLYVIIIRRSITV